MVPGDLVEYKEWDSGVRRPAKLGVVIEHAVSPPVENTTCFDGPTGQSRTRVAWVDGSGLRWVNTSNLRKKNGRCSSV